MSPTTQPAEMKNRGFDQLNGALEELNGKYGLETIRRKMLDYADKLDQLSLLNRELNEMGDQKDNQAFADKVQEIISATQGYYTYIGSLPGDIRHFFQMIADTYGGSDESIAQIAQIMGIEHFQLDPIPLISVQSIRPKNYIMQVDAITNQLANLGDKTHLRVGSRHKQPVNTTVTLDMPNHMRIEGGGMLSTYDKSIINAVTSLMESGNTIFSVPMLYHAMTGKQNPSIDSQLYEEISGKLEKMRRMMLSIDLSQEKEAQYFKNDTGEILKIEDVTLEGYLLPLNKVSGVINGKKTELYQIIQHPPLYTYSKLRRQLASVPITILDAPVNNNSTTIPLKTYLLQRIEMMKNQHNQIRSRSILYESVYQELNAQDAGKTRKMRIRVYTQTILQSFIEKGYIQNYSEFKKGRAIAGIHIQL